MIEVLTFDLVDDICLGLESATLSWSQVPTCCAHSLGPIFEMTHVFGNEHRGKVSPGIYTNLIEASAQNIPSWFCASERQGLTQVRRLKEDQVAWTDFSIRASRAAHAAGFSKNDAWKLMAAIGEIYSNIIDHSENVDSGYIAYSTNGNSFEFVVGDKGIGVLSSLRNNPAYVQVTDSGTALEYALSEGVSRLQQPGHGFGFQPIFVGLANVSTRVRFRSGDYGRELQRSADGAIPATTIQLARIEGLFCSVLCAA